jgi:hypothetical protein
MVISFQKVKPLIKLAEVPNMTNIAGPMQQDAAKNEVKIVPILDMFSVFISVHHCT